MKNDIDSKLFKVFETIRLKGQQEDDSFTFLKGRGEGTRFDGYTLFLKDALVELVLDS